MLGVSGSDWVIGKLLKNVLNEGLDSGFVLHF